MLINSLTAFPVFIPVKVDQLATGWWTQMHNSTEGMVDWFIENKVEGERKRSGGAGRCGWQAGRLMNRRMWHGL